MERGLVMIVHAVIIALLSYALMFYALKQNQSTAENRSVLVGAIVLAYMVVFGHELPSLKSLKRL